MPQGLEVFDENGRKIMDSKTHVSFVLGVMFPQAETGSIVDPRFLYGRPFRYLPDATQAFSFLRRIRIRIEGDTLTWDIPSGMIGKTRILYGVVL